MPEQRIPCVSCAHSNICSIKEKFLKVTEKIKEIAETNGAVDIITECHHYLDKDNPNPLGVHKPGQR